VATVAAWLLLFESPAFAIQVSIESLTLMPDNTSSGVYSSAGLGTATWDSDLSVLNPGGTVADVGGASTSAQVRYALAMTAAATGADTDTLSATSHFQVTFALTNNDPTNTRPVEVSIALNGSGVMVDDGPPAGFRSEYSFSPTGSSFSKNGVTDTWNPAPSDSVGLGNGNSTFAGLNTTFGFPADFGAGTEHFTLDLYWTNVLSVNNQGSTAVLAGLNTGLNPLIGAAQFYPSAQGHLDPAADGQFVSITATVVPEPSTLALAALGGLALLLGRRRDAERLGA
jgi:hypothetical protein